LFWAGIGVGVPISAGLCPLARLLARRLRLDYRLASAFDTATKVYQQWWERTHAEFWLRLTGLEFERELSELFRKMGYQTQLTPSSNDRGVDIWIQKGDEKIIVQCKAHSSPVGPGVARELYGTLHDTQASSAILASVSGFTKGVCRLHTL
jgi:HJR/Mrr/RecB family endonuclease